MHRATALGRHLGGALRLVRLERVGEAMNTDTHPVYGTAALRALRCELDSLLHRRRSGVVDRRLEDRIGEVDRRFRQGVLDCPDCRLSDIERRAEA